MGERLRLKASYVIPTNWPIADQAVARALKKYGAIVADKSMNDLKDRIEREVRARLGQDQWARAFAAGGRAPVDSLLADIDTARG